MRGATGGASDPVDDGVDQAWVDAIQSWAAGEPLIEAAYVFGSRVKGTYHLDSDLDVAVIVVGADDGERLGSAIAERARWTEKLQPRIPVKLHLQCAMDDDVVVMPAVRDHGRLIYSIACFRPNRVVCSGGPR